VKLTVNGKEIDLDQIFKGIDFESSCKGKVKYGHRETAESACTAMKRKRNLDLEPYECRHCDGWHIGHSWS
jgi:hypothetical protein